MFYHARELNIQIQGRQFGYIRFGSGSKNLILIQGLNTRGIRGAALSLAYMYRIFAKEYTVYLFDRRPDVADGTTVRELAADVAAAMDALGIISADVIGVSQGGMIGQYLAIDRPDLVNKLILAVTLAKNNETVQTVIENWITLTKQGDFKELVADMAEKMYSDSYLKIYRSLLPLLTLLQTPKDPERFINLAKACLTCNAHEELDKIRCPVLVIGGGEDKIVSSAASLEIAEKLNCPVYLYENLGHAAYEEAKDFNRRMYDFLKGD